MDKLDTNPRARIAAEAAEWALHLQSDNSPETRGEFVDWLRTSPLHVAEALRFAEIEALLGEFSGWNKLDSKSSRQMESSNVVPLSVYATRQSAMPPSLPQRTTFLRRAAMLAAAVAVVTIGALLAFRHLDSNIITTQHLEHREITLADGSIVNIAPDTTLGVHFTNAERAVTLDRGEALFHVAKNPNRPFVVTSDHTQVRAVGTAFSVARQASGVVITVAEGVVAVTPKNAPKAAAGTNRPIISLSANQQLTVSESGAVGQTRAIDGRDEFAWTESRLIFENSSVADVVRRFNSRNRLQIRIEDPALATRPVSGIFNATDPQSFVTFLEAAAGARTIARTQQEIVLGAPSDANYTVTAH